MKAAKYLLYTLLALLGLAVAGAAVFALTFDPNRYKDDIERLVAERTGRTLKLGGDIAVAFYPSLGAKVGAATLSERGRDTRFLAFEAAHGSVALLPLLRGEVIVDKISVSGLQAQVVKDKEGRFNFQDLLEKEPAPGAKPEADRKQGGEPVKFDIAGVTVENSTVSYHDLASGRQLALDELNLVVGRIAEVADGKLKLSVRAKGNQPVVDARVDLAAGYRVDLPAKSFALSGIDATVTGAAAGLTDLRIDGKGDVAASPERNEYRVSGLDVQFRGNQGKAPLEAKLSAPALVIAADSAMGEAVNAEFRFKGDDRSVDVTMKLSGLQGSAKALVVPQFSADLALSDPGLPVKSVKIPVTGNLRANLEKRTADAEIKAKIDESSLQAKLGLARFDPPAYRFDVEVDQLNVDRYVPPKKAEASGPAGDSGPAAAAGKPEAPASLSALKGLDASGRLRIGALQARGLKLANVKAEVRAAGGRAEVAPHSADLYGGSVAGALALQADGNRVVLKEKLSNVNIGPLLRDFAQQDRLEGRGNLSVDVTAAGATGEAMKKALAGTARIDLRDGAIKGIDIAGALRKAKSALGRDQPQAASPTEKTDFSELTATFAIKGGVAHNEDLDVKAPLFRLAGRGDIDIGNSRLDYVTKVSVVATAKGQGGPELEELRGLTVPVRLRGPFDNLAYQVDYGAVAADLAKSRAGEKLKERVGKERGKLEERLGDRLKGLLGR